MAHAKKTPPEFPIEAYQFAEIHHLGSPVKMYRPDLSTGPGCILAVVGFVVALVPLAGFMYDDYAFSPELLHVTGYCVAAFLMIAGILLLPGFLKRKVRVYLYSRGLIYIRKKPAKRQVIFWEQVSQVESPEHDTRIRRPSAVRMIGRDLLFAFGLGGETVGLSRFRWGSSNIEYCILHLEDGSKIHFSQWIENLNYLAKDIRRHLRKSGP